MGTRGFVGLVVDGVEKIGYNHWDSYPSAVGTRVLHELRREMEDPERFRSRATALMVVSDKVLPTPEQREELLHFANLDVSTGGTDEWYVLLRETQGSLRMTLDAGYVEDHADFPLDSLFCEWGYLVDLDAEVFEVYRGLQKRPPTEGRWASQGNPENYVVDDYYAVQRVAEWKLTELPTDEAFQSGLQQA